MGRDLEMGLGWSGPPVAPQRLSRSQVCAPANTEHLIHTHERTLIVSDHGYIIIVFRIAWWSVATVQWGGNQS